MSHSSPDLPPTRKYRIVTNSHLLPSSLPIYQRTSIFSLVLSFQSTFRSFLSQNSSIYNCLVVPHSMSHLSQSSDTVNHPVISGTFLSKRLPYSGYRLIVIQSFICCQLVPLPLLRLMIKFFDSNLSHSLKHLPLFRGVTIVDPEIQLTRLSNFTENPER